jgi:hypothetical protein
MEQGALAQPPPTTKGDAFGAATAVWGDTAMVAYQDPSKGKVLVFRRVGSSWSLASTITVPPASADLVYFGYSLALQQDRAVVGAPADDPVNARAFVYERSGGTWNLQAELAPDSTEANYFGLSVAVDDGTIVVGAPDYMAGASDRTYVFVGAGAAWTQQAELAPGGPASQGSYGVAVSVTGDDLLVGAPYAATTLGGGVFAYERAGTTWTDLGFIDPPVGSPSDGSFGNSVSARGAVAIVGAPGMVFNSTNHTGFAFVLGRGATGWTATQTLEPKGGEPGGYFGCSVALVGSAALVGAFGYNQPGRAYLFEQTGGIWAQHQSFVSPTAEAGSGFGYAVALAETAAVVGQPSFFGGLVGEAWAYLVHRGVGHACATGQDCDNGLCVDGVCCETECGDGIEDDCQACSVAMGSAVNGKCSALSGVSCAGGVCDQGVCLAPDGGSAGAAGGAGASGAGGGAGEAGASGMGGSAGASGMGGSAGGAAGTAGSGGSGGVGGGAPTGGTGGEGPTGGSGGDSDAGKSGSAGSTSARESVEDGGFYSCGVGHPRHPRPLVLVVLGVFALWFRRRFQRN